MQWYNNHAILLHHHLLKRGWQIETKGKELLGGDRQWQRGVVTGRDRQVVTRMTPPLAIQATERARRGGGRQVVRRTAPPLVFRATEGWWQAEVAGLWWQELLRSGFERWRGGAS
jgi:hypothetical protein